MYQAKIFPLPKPEDDQALAVQARAFRDIRLRALRADPQGFRAKYEDELDKPLEFWMGRLQPAHIRHFVAVVAEDESDANPLVDENTVFQALGVVVPQKTPQRQGADCDGSIVEESTYHLFGLWVDPALRRQGMASTLIRRTVECVKADAKSRGSKSVKYCTAAAKGNDQALKLYLKLGFQVDTSGSGEDSSHAEIPLVMKVAIDHNGEAA